MSKTKDSSLNEAVTDASFDSTEEQDGTPASMNKVRIMLILNDRRLFQHAIAFLTHRDYEIKIAFSLSEVIEQLPKFRPHVVLISWNLRRTDVRRVYLFLQERFNILCIAFAEETSTRTAASLLSSGLPNALLPPISGPGIHMRIQSLLRPKKKRRTEKTNGPTSKKMIQRIKERAIQQNIALDLKDIPTDTQWEQNSANADEQTIWKGHSKNGTISFFKGTKPPRYDEEKQEWIAPAKSSLIFLSKDQSGEQNFELVQEGISKDQAFSLTQEGPKGGEFEFKEETDQGQYGKVDLQKENNEKTGATSSIEVNLFDWNSKIEEAKKDFGNLLDAFSDSPPPPPEKEPPPPPAFGTPQEGPKRSSILELATRDALNAIGWPPLTDVAEITGPTPLYGISIDTPDFIGYLVCTGPAGLFDYSLAKELKEKLVLQMKFYGRPIEPHSPVIDFQILIKDFRGWCLPRSRFQIYAEREGQAIGFAFIPTPRFPTLVEQPKGNLMKLDLAKNISANKPLLFDLFLHLPKNDKLILYYNTGTVIPQKKIKKLLQYGVTDVYAKSGALEKIIDYIARNQILGIMNPEDYEDVSFSKK